MQCFCNARQWARATRPRYFGGRRAPPVCTLRARCQSFLCAAPNNLVPRDLACPCLATAAALSHLRLSARRARPLPLRSPGTHRAVRSRRLPPPQSRPPSAHTSCRAASLPLSRLAPNPPSPPLRTATTFGASRHVRPGGLPGETRHACCCCCLLRNTLHTRTHTPHMETNTRTLAPTHTHTHTHTHIHARTRPAHVPSES